jgi:hypothetical protein
MSRVVVNINDRNAGDNRAVALHAGLVGVAQDDDGALHPVAGWYLAPAALEIDDVIDRILRDHETTPAQPVELRQAAPDLVALYQRMGSATLFDGAWRLLAAAEQLGLVPPRLPASQDDHRTGRRAQHLRVLRLRDPDDALGRLPGRAEDGRGCRSAASRLPPGRGPRRGPRLRHLARDAAMDSGGDITHLETGRLDQLSDSPLDKRRTIQNGA